MESNLAIPWRMVRFAEVCEHSAFGPRFGGEQYALDGNVATLRTTDIDPSSGIDYRTMPRARLDLSRLEQHLLQRDDLVMTRSGRVGTTAVFRKHDVPVLPGAFLIRFRLKKTIASPQFYDYFFKSERGQNLIQSVATGSAQQNINITNLHELVVPLPPLQTQDQIVNILSALDNKIELNRKTNETTEAIATTIFKSWFVDFDPVRAKAEGRPTGLPSELAALFPDSFEDSELGEVPLGWPIAPVTELIEVDPKRHMRKGAFAPYLEMKGVPVRGHCADGVFQREFTSGSKFINGDTLLARITPCLENGKTALVDFLADGEVGWGSTEFIVLCGKSQTASEFVYYLARSEAFRAHAIQNMVGSSGRQRVPADCFNSFLMPVPPQALLDSFSAFAANAIKCIRRNADESDTLGQIRDTLLPKLISGELRVPEAEAILEGAAV